MEKRKPHHKLEKIKGLVKEGQVSITRAAMLGADSLDLNKAAMLDVILNLQTKDFYKSMTSYCDHTQWQDVYRPSIEQGNVYLKFTVIEDVLILSFKTL